MNSEKITVSIWGSCVSRDIVRLNEAKFDLDFYLARQSWVSAVSKPVKAPPGVKLESQFQRNSLIGDLTSNARAQVRRYAPDSDVFLIDLATDRRGVYPIGDDQVASNTAELIESGLAKELRTGPLIPFGSDEHFSRFADAATKVADFLRMLGVFHKTLVIRSPFVNISREGEAVPQTHGRSSEDWNQNFLRYFGELESLGFRITDPLPTEFQVSTTSHAWGVGQDHYVVEAYDWWTRRIEEFARK